MSSIYYFIICLGTYFLLDLVEKRTSFKPSFFFLSKEDREICKVLREDVNVRVPDRAFLASFLHNERGQEGVFGRNESLPKTLLIHLPANGGCYCHFQSDNLFLRNVQNYFTLLDISGCMHSSVIGRVEPNFQLIKL